MGNIKVTVSANKPKSVSVTSQQVANEISASADTGRIWAQTSKNWAVSDAIVNNEDYSSKYYANQAKESATLAEHYEELARNSYNAFSGALENAVNDVQEARDEAIESVTTIATTGVGSVDEKINTGIANIEAKTSVGVELVEATKTNAVTEINNTKTTAVNEVNTSKNEALNAINQTGVGNLANKDLSNLSATGEARFASGLNNKLTNCLLAVPQNIKLELNNGVLTLKAGSKVIVPNVAGLFEEITIANDLTRTWTFNGKGVVCATSSTLMLVPLAQTSSGATAPTVTTTYWLWYDTTNNQIKFTSDNGATWTGVWSLPVCLITGTSSGITSIDQVFNGFGYIGSTVWIDKGVKGLIPNGRNADGTLNNIEFQNNALNTITYTNDIKGVYFGCSMDGAPQLNGLYSYDEKDNYVYNGENKVPVLYCGTYDVVGGKVANFQPKQPFIAVDYNEAVLKSSLKEAQVVVETYINGTSWYRVWSDGWKEQGGKAQISSEGQKINLLLTMSNTNYHCLSTGGQSPFGNTVMYGLTTNSFQVFTADDNSFNAGILFWEVKGY